MPTRALFVSVVAAASLVVLLAACSNGDAGTADVGQSTPAASATPAVTPSPSPTPAPTALPTATPSATPAASPTPPAGDRAVFCETTVDGQIGYLRKASCANSENGFVMDAGVTITSTVRIGDFVPECLQPLGDEGMTVIVGTLCTTFAGGSTTLTNDPLPVELRGTVEDGDLVPWCRIGTAAPWAIEVGPPCIYAGPGPVTILSGPGRLEGAADCTAGLTYMFELVEPFEQLITMLDGVLAQHAAGERAGAAETLRAELVRLASIGLGPEPGERAMRFVEGWEAQSPIVMRDAALQRLGELLAALDGDGVAANELGVEIRDGLQEAIFWFTAGRGC